ncbi:MULTISPECIES: hypothetical protein [unclassified Nonomuraea]
MAAAFVKRAKFVATVTPDGRTLVRDPRTTPTWHDLSTVENYPGNVVGVSLANTGPDLDVVVRNADGRIAHAVCTVWPEPGDDDDDTPAWPDNCEAFWDLTPPN